MESCRRLTGLSGANGFLGSQIVKVLLDRGFSARGTVRSVSKGESLKAVFSKYEERFSYVVVSDVNAVSVWRTSNWAKTHDRPELPARCL